MAAESLAPAQYTRLPTHEELGFNPDALREKYRRERDKRLRADGNEQYQEVVGDFAHYIDDPYSGPVKERAALKDEVEVIIVGGGFGGLICGARLREIGIQRIRIIEQAGDVGGTWYWNRYPGAACDTEAYIYLPLCEELGYVPKTKYAFAPEILDHARRIADHFRLYDDICLHTHVIAMRWDAAAQRWCVTTNRGDDMRAQFVIMSNGPLNRPKLPGIPGIRDYKGHTFHTSRWDYEYTGGSSEGGLDRLADKRVGIIGTGATAVQCVPHLGAGAKALYVFQRTPSSVDVRDNRKTDPAWAAGLHPGWQRERMENFNTLTSGGVVEKDLIQDGWTEIIRNLVSMAKFRGTGVDWADVPKLMEIADFQKMNQIRDRVDSIVKDKTTAEALKPWYRQFCKRPCFHDDYLPTFNRPNVHLIDTNGMGVERVTEKGIVANGIEYEVDCIVFATGFEVGTAYTRRSGYDVEGRDGLKISDKWADGIRTLHGYMTHGFPNLFIVGNSQNAATTNFPHAMDESAVHFQYLVKQCRERGIGAIEPDKSAEDAWVEHIISISRFNEAFLNDCTPGYYNNEGKPSRRAMQNGAYGKGPNPFFRITKAWREAGTLEGMLVR
jgi:cyclohexanone monooxygenase